MLRGAKSGLGARHDDDVPILRTELYDDVVNGPRADGPGVATDLARFEGRAARPRRDGGGRGAVLRGRAQRRRADRYGDVAGDRQPQPVRAHRAAAGLPRKGYGTDVVWVLCCYGRAGLQRLQIETLADNAAMLRAAERNGFVRAGVLRSSAWVLGEFLDEVVPGLLATEWKPGSSQLS